MTFRLIGESAAEVDAAAAWFDGRSTGLGRQFALAFADRMRLIVSRPQMYARVNRPPRGRDIRQAPIKRFPFTITYEMLPTEIVVLSVGHHRLKRQPWRRRRP